MPTTIDNGSTGKIALYCVLSSDHITAATGKTIAVTISKNGAAFGNPSGGATNATEVGSGWYYFTPSATDTGTNGPLLVLGTNAATDDSTQGFVVAAAATAAPTAAAVATAVWQDATAGDFTVSSSIGKSLYTSGVAPGSSGGLLKIGTSPLPASGTLAAATWDEINTGATHNITNSTGKQLRSITSGSTDAIYPLSGTVNLTAATSTTATLDASASAVSQAYQWDVLNILSGTGAGQSRIITNYTTGRVATVSPAFTTTPDATSTFDITPTASVQVVSYIAGQAPLQPATTGRTLAVSSAGGVTLADGVTHGGTPGSSTATYAGQQFYIVNSSGHAVFMRSTGGGGAGLTITGSGSGGINVDDGGVTINNNSGDALQLFSWGSNGSGIDIQANGSGDGIRVNADTGAGVSVLGARAFKLNGTGSGLAAIDVDAVAGPGIRVHAHAADMPGITVLAEEGDSVSISSFAGHGINVFAAGSGKKALLLAGDAVTDSVAIAAGSGSPINVFDAAARVLGRFDAAGLATLFTINSTKLYADAVTGSPVKEIGSQASGGGTVDAHVVSYASGEDPATLLLASPANKLATDSSGRVTGSATLLDATPITDPGGTIDSFPKMMVQLWRWIFRPAAKNATNHTIKTLADDGITVHTTQPYTDDGAGNQTHGSAT